MIQGGGRGEGREKKPLLKRNVKMTAFNASLGQCAVSWEVGQPDKM